MNMIFKLFSAGALMFLGVACTSCEKENENNKESDIPMEQVSYKASNEIIVNPERGFYKATSCEMGISGALSVSTLKNYRANGYSLIFRYFYLKNFRDKALTDEALQFFDKDMAAMREAGVKCVLRFAYTSLETEPDAPLSIIQTHIDQLKPYLAKNADVIAVWQAGFIGSWGEWYYTTNNLNVSRSGKSRYGTDFGYLCPCAGIHGEKRQPHPVGGQLPKPGAAGRGYRHQPAVRVHGKRPDAGGVCLCPWRGSHLQGH